MDIGVQPEEALKLYETMLQIRFFEEKVMDLFAKGLLAGTGFVHLCIGQEATAAGACRPLRQDDYITSTHRGHGHCIAKGVDMRFMMAELFGKRTGCAKGRAGSMHLSDISFGHLGANGILAAGMPIAVGAALSARIRGTDQIAVSFFGEGASAEGTSHEAINMAAVWRLPVIFFCEVNRYAELTGYSTHVPTDHVADRAQGYGIPGLIIDGNDALQVYKTMQDTVARVRGGQGPVLIEARTARWRGHYEGDPQKYRPPGELEELQKNDPILRLENELVQAGILGQQQVTERRATALAQVEEAVAYAEASPDPLPDDLYADVYA